MTEKLINEFTERMWFIWLCAFVSPIGDFTPGLLEPIS